MTMRKSLPLFPSKRLHLKKKKNITCLGSYEASVNIRKMLRKVPGTE